MDLGTQLLGDICSLLDALLHLDLRLHGLPSSCPLLCLTVEEDRRLALGAYPGIVSHLGDGCCSLRGPTLTPCTLLSFSGSIFKRALRIFFLASFADT